MSVLVSLSFPRERNLSSRTDLSSRAGRKALKRSWIGVNFALLTVLAGSGCGQRRPPAPQPESRGTESAQPTRELREQDQAVLSYASPGGQLVDVGVEQRSTIPAQVAGMVMVSPLTGPAAGPGRVWVANVAGDKPLRLQSVARATFEELAFGQGLSNSANIPEGLTAPDVPAVTDTVVVYKTAWCGVCRRVEAYLKRKGIRYEAKDIEQDIRAAGELKAKAQAVGAPMGSVPVIDVKGQLVLGFDKQRLDQLL